MIATSSATTALGIFNDSVQAKQAIHALKNAGFRDKDIGIASREWSTQFDNVDVNEQHVAEKGAIAYAALGATLGAAFGLVGAILVPGALPVLAGSTLLSGLLGGAAGAAGGAFAGPFIAMGLSEMDAEKHSQHVQEGKIVVLVHDPERRDEARKVMVKEGAYDDAMANSP
jgi:hypothetical protein